MIHPMTIGIDTAKRIFFLHGESVAGKVILRQKLTREQLVPYLANQPECTIAIEAGCGAHHWARAFSRLGHQVRLIHPKFVKPFVKMGWTPPFLGLKGLAYGEAPSQLYCNGSTVMPQTTYGVDIAKRVFQVHWIDGATGEVHSRSLTRGQVSVFFANRPTGLIALEACGSGHYWARTLAALGHEVRLLHPKYIRPFVRTNKTDAADAEAICIAAQQPGIRSVTVKNEEQQAMLGLHRMREQLVKFRTMQVNQVRGLLNEFGFVFRSGRRAGLADIRAAMAELEDRVPGLLMTGIRAQLARLEVINQDVAAIERQMQSWQRRESDCQRLVKIPGIGPIIATALVASIGNAKAFRSGREFAAFLGLVPRQSGTGGRVKLLGISKRGDSYLRKLLVHGARTVLFRSKTLSPWMSDLLKRRHKNVVTVALANKMARTAWALMAHERSYSAQWCAASSG